MKALVLGLVMIVAAAAAPADILQWTDADGVRHFTNLKSEVPKAQRESAEVFVDEQARKPEFAENMASATAGAPAESADPPRQAQVVYDQSTLSHAYLAGLERGLAAAAGPASVAGGGGVQVNGPLAVAEASNPTPYYGYLPYHHFPLVTTSFDRGRSRHLTLRMLLQDQFAIDRDELFLSDGLGFPSCQRPGLTVALNPFVPRGRPSGFPRTARVVSH